MPVFGFNYPFLSQNSVLPPQAEDRLIKNDLKQLLLTSLGERVMRSNLGTEIRETQFEPIDTNTTILLEQSIRQAIKKFEPRVLTREIKILANPDSGYMEISIFASLTRDPNRVINVTVTTASSITQPTQAL